MKTLQETRDKIGAFLGALKDTGHKAEDVRNVLMEIVGEFGSDEPDAWLVCFPDGSSRVYDPDYSIHQMKACGAAAIPLYPRTVDVPSDANRGEN